MNWFGWVLVGVIMAFCLALTWANRELKGLEHDDTED